MKLSNTGLSVCYTLEKDTFILRNQHSNIKLIVHKIKLVNKSTIGGKCYNACA